MENKELQADLKRQRTEGEMIREMTATRGWTEVVLPILLSRKEALQKGLLTAKEHVEFLKAQQCINTINFILDTVVGETISIGKVAAETLEQQKESVRKEMVES